MLPLQTLRIRLERTVDQAGAMTERVTVHSYALEPIDVDVEITLARRGEKSVTYSFRFAHQDRLVAEGRMTSVCCRLVADQPPRSIAIPEWIVAKLDV